MTNTSNISKSKAERIMGPNESNYRQNYNDFVTNTISRYVAQTQSNLHTNGTLPNYAEMSVSERMLALKLVDELLERLTTSEDGDNALVGAKGVAGASRTHGSDITSNMDSQTSFRLSDDGSGCELHDDSVTILGGEFSRGNIDTTFGSATTLGQDGQQLCDETHGSETTMGENDRESTSTGATERTNDISLMLEKSMNLLSDADDDVGSAGGGSACAPDAAEDEESRFSEGEDAHCDMNSRVKSQHRSNYSPHNTTTSPIERARHTQVAFNDGRNLLDTSTTPPVFPPSKRYASNSGKRGLKTRHRSNHDGVNDELFGGGHFDGFCGRESDSGMHQYFQDDESPIQRCFTNDGSVFECDYEMAEDELHDLPDRHRTLDGATSNAKNRKSEMSGNRLANFDGESSLYGDGDVSICHDDYEHDTDDDDVDADRDMCGDNAERSTMQQHHSQWSSFRNANANFTATQFDGDADNKDSPLRRAKLYAGESQQNSSRQQTQLKCQGRSRLTGDIDENDPIQTVRNACRRAKCLEKQGLDSLQEVAPIDVRVRDGMHYRLDPLQCHNDKDKTNKPSDQSRFGAETPVKDPISDFPSRVSARLNAGLAFLLDKERHLTSTANNVDNESENPCAILLSMSIHQILCVTSKLLTQTSQSTRKRQRSRNTSSVKNNLTPSLDLSSKDGEYLAGGTLIVLRGKEDIEQWEVALREYTSLSVLNHAAMQANIRKLGPTAAKCAGFDVVISTYDAVKTKEVTIPVDARGCAILGSNGRSDNDEGWLASRASGAQTGASAQQKCLPLSVLHRLCWCRVIFLDVLGLKGFLTKPGTARSVAAIALNSKSRFVLFEHAGDTSSKAESKFLDNRKQLSSMLPPLHLPGRMKLDTFVNEYILDVKKTGGSRELDLLDSSSKDDTEDETDHDNITE